MLHSTRLYPYLDVNQMPPKSSETHAYRVTLQPQGWTLVLVGGLVWELLLLADTAIFSWNYMRLDCQDGADN